MVRNEFSIANRYLPYQETFPINYILCDNFYKMSYIFRNMVNLQFEFLVKQRL